MEIQLFEVTGKVIESVSGTPLGNLKIEAWDKDVKYDDLLGQTFTDAAGSFSLSFDSTYFREHAPDPRPDLYFKVFIGKRPLKIINDEVIKNAGFKTDVTLKVEIPEMRPRGEDRVNPERTLQIATFIQQSDFTGIIGQYRERAGASLNLFSDMLINTVKKMDLTPLKTSETRTANIVGQDVPAATAHLERQQVVVNEVKEYDPRLSKQSLSDIAGFQADIKPGQRVNLYQENGKVRYYSIEKEAAPAETMAAPATAKPATAAPRDKTVTDLQDQLKATRLEAAAKDEQIKKLQSEMESLRKDQLEIKTLLQSDALAKILKNAGRQRPGTGRTKPDVK